jgi:Ca-activated chloride channel family protein
MNNSTAPIFRKLVLWVVLVELVSLAMLLSLLVIEPTGSLQFLSPASLYVGIALPIVALAWLLHWDKKQKIAAAYSGQGNTSMLQIGFNFNETFFPYLFFRSALFFVVIAMAQPVAGKEKIKGTLPVVDLVICLDVSNSMNTVDMGSKEASRLDAAKNAITEITNNLSGERLSVVIFANDAYVQLPLTMDYGAAKLFVPDIETSMISDQGTNIGKALEIAQTQFKDSEAGQAILIITDGEDHEALWKAQVESLKQKKISLFYLGLGSSQGGLIPVDPYNSKLGYKRVNGAAVVSRVDASAIQQMASATGSQYEISSSVFPPVFNFITQLKQVKSKSSGVDFEVSKHYYTIPTLIAIFCLLAYYFIPTFYSSKQS